MLNRSDKGEVVISAIRGAAHTVMALAALQPAWVHRDLSLGNIIIDLDYNEDSLPDGSTYVIDWATAQQVVPGRKNCSTRQLTGTYIFMGLTVLRGLPHTTSSDLESLAMVLVHLACDMHAPWSWMITPDHVRPEKESKLLAPWSWRELCDVYMQPGILRDAAQQLHGLFWGSKDPADEGGYNTKVTPEQFLDALRLPARC